MNFKNISIILALFSFELKVFSHAVDYDVSDGEVTAVENLNAEVSADEVFTISVDDDTNLKLVEESDSEDSELTTDAVDLNDDLELNELLKFCDWAKEIGYMTNEESEYIISHYQSDMDTLQQKFDAINYGIKVEVNGHQMSVNISGEQNDKTIVLLPALGTLSPVLFYKGLVESLSTDFKVITIEPFGYGLSDVVEEERKAENVVSEIHDCLKKLGVDKFYFMGHSIGGIYSIIYSNTPSYSDDVLGFIGLDNTPSNFDTYKSMEILETQKIFYEGLDKYHIWNFVPEDIVNIYLPQQMDPRYNYSEKELEEFKSIFGYRYNNVNLLDENYFSEYNVGSTKGMNFQCPILLFISSETSNLESKWRPMHEAMIINPENSELFPLEGTHWLIHSEHKEEITKDIKEWINKIEKK